MQGRIVPFLLALVVLQGCAFGDKKPSEPLVRYSIASNKQAIAANSPKQYTVVKGDTLWDISERFLSEPWRWPEIWINNPHVKNPHLIYPGDVVAIEWINGKPRWVINGGQRFAKRPVASIPRRAIEKYLQSNGVVSEHQWASAPSIVGIADGRQMAADGMLVYVLGLAGEVPRHFDAIRKGQVYRDPETGQVIGYEVLQIARLGLEQQGKLSVLSVNDSVREVKVGDRILAPSATFQNKALTPVASVAIQGQVAAVFGEADMAGLHDVVVVNRGADKGLAPGQVLRLLEKTTTFVDPKTQQTVKAPNREIAQGLVFDVSEQYAHLLLLKSIREARVGDWVIGSNE